jgi:acetyl esterase/lipase
VGQCEVLRDQVVEFSRRALAAGVDVTLQEWVDMVRRLL